ncbi:MAG: purine-nucleoside phosphorylase, partial [Bacilli bacterium]
MTERFTQIQQAADYINSIIKFQPEFGLILGSGLGDLAEQIENPTYVPYNEIPHFPQSTVAGHAGRFVAGTLEGRQVLAMQGRFHFYEGYSIQQVTLPVYVMKQLGIDKLFVTNAAGGMNDNFQAGDLM